ncbi:ABC transporter ATP-binding protein [Enterococcus rivorum]
MIYDLVSREVAQFFNAIIYISIGVIVLFILDWKLLIVVLFGIPLFFILFIPVGRILSKISKNIQDSIANLNERAFQMTSENTLTKISSAENFEIGIGKKKIATLKQHLVKQIKILAFLTPVVNLIVMGIVISIITYGGIRVADGTLSVGTLIGFMIVVVMIINPISNLSSFFSELQRTKGATERISEILNERVEKLELGQNIDIRGKSLRLREVEFRYQNQDDGFKLNNINMSIEVGSKHALVGPSGGGKSTILALIERLYDLDSGEILLGNLNVNEISLKSWRSQIGYVSQENDLISGTIKENLLYGLIEENVDDTDIIFACKAAFAWEFIEEMSDKLDTMIGERGVTLSGGQRQRLSIARTFLRNPNILLLDEATANLDSNSEKQIQDAIDNIMKGRTVIAIAHRLSTIINSDQIYFVQEGTITGYGTHEELLGSHHLYKEFYKQQMESGL